MNSLRPWTSRRGISRGLLICTCLLMLVSGCGRAYWRRQADEQSYGVINERFTDPRWLVPRVNIEPDPQSRMFDPYDRDKPPMPPDDPAAHQYMIEVNGMKGSKEYQKLGTAVSIENPNWYMSLGLPAEWHCPDGPAGQYLGRVHPKIENLTLPEAIELSYTHSRPYQTQLEALYLAALDVTQERFVFAVRYIGISGQPPSFDIDGVVLPHRRDFVTTSTRAGIGQLLLPTGAQWGLEFFNNTIWFFSGDNRTNSFSVLSYNLTQPLLRGAGRKIALESLTQSERLLLYQVRELARFRKQLFVETVVGGPSGGFLGILQQRQLVLNRADNVRRLEEQVQFLRILNSQRKRIAEQVLGLPPEYAQNGFPEELTGDITETTGILFYNPISKELIWLGEMSPEQEDIISNMLQGNGNDTAQIIAEKWFTEAVPPGPGEFTNRVGNFAHAVDEAIPNYFRKALQQILQQQQTESEPLDVSQLLSRLANSQSGFQTGEQTYQNTLDNFKIQLGLPPDVEMTIDETLLEQFQLIDPRLFALEQQIRDSVSVIASVNEYDPSIEQLREAVRSMMQYKQLLEQNGIALVEQDFERVKKILDDNHETGERVFFSPEERRRVEIDVLNDLRQFNNILSEFRQEFLYDTTSVTSRLNRLWELVNREELPLAERQRILSELADLREKRLLKISQNLQVIQINLRVELISLQPFEMSLEQAVAAGLENRLDLMNSLANVTDNRRLMEVQANALCGIMDLVAQGEIRTPTDNNAFNFRSALSEYRLGLRITTPLDQLDERNAYRRSWIAYQQSRRAYMEFEDLVKRDIRFNWRQVKLLQQNFEITRQAVRIAARQYDSVVEAASDPEGQNLGLNLLNALDSVLNAQDSLIRGWISYEQARLELYRDMGLMWIDERGIWNDEFYLRFFASNPQSPVYNQELPPPTEIELESDELESDESAPPELPPIQPASFQDLTEPAVKLRKPARVQLDPLPGEEDPLERSLRLYQHSLQPTRKDETSHVPFQIRRGETPAEQENPVPDDHSGKRGNPGVSIFNWFNRR